jgi:hypothetical protein
MDSAWVSGTQNPGSIPGEATKRDNSNLLEKSPRLFFKLVWPCLHYI